jgi:hypothetical protein
VNIKVLKDKDGSLVAIRIQDGAKMVPSSNEVMIFFKIFFFTENIQSLFLIDDCHWWLHFLFKSREKKRLAEILSKF